jgi:hypothetical protein
MEVKPSGVRLVPLSKSEDTSRMLSMNQKSGLHQTLNMPAS